MDGCNDNTSSEGGENPDVCSVLQQFHLVQLLRLEAEARVLENWETSFTKALDLELNSMPTLKATDLKRPAPAPGPTLLKKTKRFPAEAVAVLAEWFQRHIENPYPTPEEKVILCERTQLSIKQLDTWFINARRRKK